MQASPDFFSGLSLRSGRGGSRIQSMWRPSFGEILLILAIVIMIFGVKRLPEIGTSIGQAFKNLKKSLSEDDKPKLPPSDEQPKQ